MSETSHFPDGDGWTCACGYDFFGGSAAYSWELYREHATTPPTDTASAAGGGDA